MAHDVSEIGYSYGGFDWSGGLDTTRSWAPGPPPGLIAGGTGTGGGTGEEKVDYSQLQKVLCARCRVLVKDIQRARRVLVANALAVSNTVAPLLISVPLSVLVPSPVPVLDPGFVSTPVCDAHSEVEVEIGGGPSADIQAYLELSSSSFFDQIAGTDGATTTTTTTTTTVTTTTIATIGTGIGAVNDSDSAPATLASDQVKAEAEVEVEQCVTAIHTQLVRGEANGVPNTETEADKVNQTKAVGGPETAMEVIDDVQCSVKVEVEVQAQVSDTEAVPDLALAPTPACASSSSNTEAGADAGADAEVGAVRDTAIGMTENTDIGTGDTIPLNGDNKGDDPKGDPSSGEGSLLHLPPPSLPPPLSLPPYLATLAEDIGDVLLDTSLTLPLSLSTTQPGHGEDPMLERVSVTHTVITEDITTSRKRVSTCHAVTNMPAARCTDLKLGLLWRDIASQALTIPEPLIQREILDSLDSLLKDAGRFFLCSLGDEGQHWDDFLLLQKVLLLLVLVLVFRCVHLYCATLHMYLGCLYGGYT